MRASKISALAIASLGWIWPDGDHYVRPSASNAITAIPAIEERIALGKRIRDVLEGPDGAILMLVDAAEGELLRMTPGEVEISLR